ncbi:C40 family peptidase [Crassaminicella indica]|uniref:SH3 domain-containing protein n=1 Tax=Crassaminicella indica TaxID=2855394 RepID=A0ABX8R9J5_9CLOT|nr:C40 family peptidase [Crassaminicella indica]QXM05738.1 SH3 domain-containing protein [Crassaminicella indica]
MIKFMKYFCLMVLCNLLMISFVYGEGKNDGIVIGNHVNVRQEPKMTSAVLSTLRLGEYVHILKNSGEWYGIALGDGKLGWVHNQLVIVVDKEKDFIKKGIVTANALNIRQQPDIASSSIGKLFAGTEVTIIDQKSDWYGIDIDRGKGWVHSDYIKIKPNYKIAKITGNHVNVRKAPSYTGEIVGTLNLDNYVQVKDFKDDWFNIILKENREGWVYKDYLTIVLKDVSASRGKDRSSLGMKVATIANAQLGKKYVYGASGPNTFDCSGFTSYVYRKIGIKLPRTSRGQATVGQKVSKSDLRIGDLVFFDTNGSNNGKISHVGIYIGNGKFIHASSGRKRILITDLNNDSYYKRAYVKARRLF